MRQLFGRLRGLVGPRPRRVAPAPVPTARDLGNAARLEERWEDAACLYYAHLEEQPGDCGILVQLGHVLVRLGRHEEADRAYDQALRLDPADEGLLRAYAVLHRPEGVEDADIGGTLAVCAIMKNEARNVLEWIAYHRFRGVERFFLYDNASTDDTAALLGPLIAAGIVHYQFWPHIPGQIAAYNHFAVTHGRNWQWCAFIDLDEYINIFDDRTIPAWLERFSGAAGVVLQWMNFGPSGHDLPPAGLQLEHYVHRFPEEYSVHGHVKTIVHMADYKDALTPHSFAVTGVVLDEYGDPVRYVDGEYAIQAILPHAEACITHFYTRSRSDWELKRARGRADLESEPGAAHHESWFDIYAGQAIVHDDRLVRQAPGVAAELERLHAL